MSELPISPQAKQGNLRREWPDHGPVAEKAKSRISRAYSRASRRAGASGRLPKTAAHELLVVVYRYVAAWRADKTIGGIMRQLRHDCPSIIERASTQYLTLLRAALPALDAKKCSKWAAALDAADYHEIAPADLSEFLDEMGGIEGAAKERARLWATVEGGFWAMRSPLRKRYLMVPPGRRR